MLTLVKLLTVLFSILVNQQLAVLAGIKVQDAWLYPGILQRGIHLRYSDTADWSDLWTLMSEHGFFTAGKLCVRGVFVLYREPLYVVSKPNAVEIFSGNMRCTLISENTKSIQMTGSVGRMYGPSITFFQKPYFGSESLSTTINVGSDFFRKMEYTRSAIIVGRTPWTLKLSTGESVCVLPEFDPTEFFPICLIKDFVTLLDSDDDDDSEDENSPMDINKEIVKNNTVILQASMGCKKGLDDEKIFRIQDCQYYGRPKRAREDLIQFEDNDTLAGRAEGKPSDLCSGGGDEESKRIFKLYKAAVTKTFDTDLLVGLDIVGKHSWKLDLLDWMFTIVNHIIPDNIIPESFLNKVRELFVHKLITVWNNNNEEFELSLLEKNYKTLLLLIEKCEETIIFKSVIAPGVTIAEAYAKEFESMWENIQTQDDFKGQINPEFERNTTKDIVTEMVWIIGHMAGYVCHEVHMMTSHYWALHFNLFWNLYMYPVRNEWNTPTQGLSMFFGGINHKVEYLKLAMFSGVTKRRARNMPPLLRPKEDANKTTASSAPVKAPAAVAPSF